MRKILLTGATGFIGQCVIPHLLAKNYSVHAVSSRPAKPDSGGVVWHHANLLRSEEVTALVKKTNPTHLMHLAWYVEPGRFWESSENLEWLRASIFLAQQFVQQGGTRIVSAGTCAEYDWGQQGPLSESGSHMRPNTLYGATKYALYLALEKFAQNTGFSYASGRIFFPFGPKEPRERIIPSVIRSLLRNEEAKTTRGEQLRDFLYVAEVARAFVALLDSDVTGAVNIASGNGSRLKDVASTIAEILDRKHLLRIGELPDRPNEPAEIVADVSRLRRELKFANDPDLTAPLVETVDWWRRNI